ncbi:MAG: polysaccharide biosynthesis C-terminal domain-containing protein [Oscillospiraceae bacterium]|nr:polysaccharide biosynthesis C-terminal domain-containing protein [Oscillospiraceae bacterium]
MSRKLNIFYSALLLTGVNLLLRLVGTSFQVYLSGRIGAAGIGLLQLTMSVGSLAMVAGMGGIRTATMYLTAEELGRGKSKNVTWVLSACMLYSILFSGTVAAALYHFAPWLAENWIGDARTLSSLRLFSAFLPVVCLCGVMTGYFTAANRIGTLAAVEVAEQMASMMVTMTFLILWAGNDPGRACLSVVLGSALGTCLTLLCLVILRLRERPAQGARIPVASRLLQAAVPLALADDLKSGINTAENLMVPKRLALCTAVESPLAAFGIVSGMVFPVIMFPAAILFGLTELLIPELARCNAAGSQKRICYLVRRSLRVALVYGLLFGGLLYLLAESLCLRLYGNLEAAQDLRRYSLLVPMLYCDAITDAMTKGLGQQKVCVRYNIFTSTLDIVFLYLLLPEYGMAGYFASFLVTHLVNFLLSLRRLLKITGQHIPFHIPVLAVSSWTFSVWGAAFLPTPPLRAAAYLALLSSTLFLSRLLHREDITWLTGLIRKRGPTTR